MGLTRSNQPGEDTNVFSTQGFPALAANMTKNGHLYVVYADVGENTGDKADVYLVRSSNGGETPGPPECA